MSITDKLNPVEFSDGSNQDLTTILKGEISAKEAYDQVMSQVDDSPEIERLKSMKKDHEEAVKFWKKQSRVKGNVPTSSSSIWGTIVKSFVGTSKILGDEKALEALKRGEEHGLSIYKDMLKSDLISDLQKVEITYRFIPNQKKHIESVNALIKLQ